MNWRALLSAILIVVVGYAVPQPTAQAADLSHTVVGSWRLAGDAKFTRTFNADGTVIDRYQGDATATTSGTWRLFTSENPDPALDSLESGVTYLRIENAHEVQFFKIIKADHRVLEMRYSDRRGDLMKFRRTRSNSVSAPR